MAEDKEKGQKETLDSIAGLHPAKSLRLALITAPV